jgi:hypothetical protein
MAKSKKSNYKVKKNSRKTYDLQLDPELQAAWATDQELPEGQFKQCWPHGKDPHPLMLDAMVDQMWAQNPDTSWPEGKDTLASSWTDQHGEIVSLRIVVCKPNKRVIVDILTPELMEFAEQAVAAGATVGHIQQTFAEHRLSLDRAKGSVKRRTTTLH